jgi:hypothetical protein
MDCFSPSQYSESFLFDAIRRRFFDDNKAGKKKPDSQDEKEKLRQKTDQVGVAASTASRNGQTSRNLNRQGLMSSPHSLLFFCT